MGFLYDVSSVITEASTSVECLARYEEISRRFGSSSRRRDN